MKRLLLALAISLSATAYAAETAPACWPAQFGGNGLSFKTGQTADGRFAAWTCVVDGKTVPAGVWAVTDYKLIHPAGPGDTPDKIVSSYWAANSGPSDTAALQRLRAAAFAAVAP